MKRATADEPCAANAEAKEGGSVRRTNRNIPDVIGSLQLLRLGLRTQSRPHA